MADQYTLNRQLMNKTRLGHPAIKAREGNGINTGRRYGGGTDRLEAGSNPYPTRETSGQIERNTQARGFTLDSREGIKFCTYCQRRGHKQPECFADPSSPKFRGPKPQIGPSQPNYRRGTGGPNGMNHSSAYVSKQRVGDTGEDEVLNPLYKGYSGEAHISGFDPRLKFPVTYLRDTGATISILYKGAVPEGQLKYTGERVSLRGINQVAGTYPMAKLDINCDLYIGTVTAAVVEHRPVPGIALLLGNEIFAPQDELKITCGVVTRARSKEVEPMEIDISSLWEPATSGSEVTVLEDPAPDSITGESDSNLNQTKILTSGNTLKPLLGEESVSNLKPDTLLREQKEDSTLTPLWELADNEGSGESGYYIQTDHKLLMRRDQPRGQKQVREWQVSNQIVVPKKYRDNIMKLAHEHISSAHQGHKKTLSRITKQFFWPGIRRDVKVYCRACGPCQRLGRGIQSSVAPLKPLPIIGRPFEFVSADFVGPLAVTPSGNRYLLNVIDHATKNVENVPIPSANAEYTKTAFAENFTRHVVPTQVLTDRENADLSNMGVTLNTKEMLSRQIPDCAEGDSSVLEQC